MNMRLQLTEHQFEELRRYEDGKPLSVGHRPNDNLIRRNMLTLVRPAGIGFYQITGMGRAALRQFRTNHGIPS